GRARAVRRRAPRGRAPGRVRGSPSLHRVRGNRGSGPLRDGGRAAAWNGVVDAVAPGARARPDRRRRPGGHRVGFQPGYLLHGVAAGRRGARLPRLGTFGRRDADRHDSERGGLAPAGRGDRLHRAREVGRSPRPRRSRRPAPRLSLGHQARRRSRRPRPRGDGEPAVTDFAPLTLNQLLSALASPASTPGGGTAAAVAGSMGAALAEMVAQLTLSKEKYASAHDAVRSISEAAQLARAEFLRLAREDSDAYDGVVAARRLPKEADAEKAARQHQI